MQGTTSKTGQALLETKTKTQEQAILRFFRNLPYRHTPSQVRGLAFADPKPTIESVRRAITRLTNSGCLIKTTERRDGPRGRPETCWQMAPPRVRVHPWRR